MQDRGTVAILCGGRGTRLQERTHSIPKALVEIGGRPIVWHVVRIYAVQGFRRFILCTGYLGDQIVDFVASDPWPDDIQVECIDTGQDTPTGGRVARVRERLDGETFHVTYADGVADMDFDAQAAFHQRHGRLATMTVVRPISQFGIAEIGSNERIDGFSEKPQLDHWVNGGFFSFEPDALDFIDEDSVLEQDPLAGLAADGQLYAYRHTGFWDCMDTYKDAVVLNDLWTRGDAPWALWERQAKSATTHEKGLSR